MTGAGHRAFKVWCIMRVTVDMRFRADTDEDALKLKETMYGPAGLSCVCEGRYISFHKEIKSEDELDEMQYYIDELPRRMAETGDTAFEYDADLDMFEDFIQIQIDYRNGRYRYQNIEEEAYYIGEKKDGRIRLRGADEDEYAMFFD